MRLLYRGFSPLFLCISLSLGLNLFGIEVALAKPDQQTQYKKQINDIAKKIKQTSKNLNANKKLLKTERHKLLEAEQNISAISRKITQTQQNISLQNQKIEQINDQIALFKQNQSDNQKALSALTYQLYLKGKPNYLKMLLNQENPYAVGRLESYYKFFNEAQQAKLQEIRVQVVQLQALKLQQQQAIGELAYKQQQQTLQHNKLSAAQKSRQTMVAQLNSKVDQSSKKLKQLQQSRDRLNNLLKEIAKQAAKLRKLEKQREAREAARLAEAKKQAAKTGKKPAKVVKRLPVKTIKGGFNKQRKRLTWPVKGNMQYKFGQRIAESGMRAEGVLITTKGSQSVHSIHQGRVVFADWLKGYGLLLIIDHGDNYLSLYGHNKLLYKKVGDMVKTNEVISKSGTTGGLQKNSVYFEIRRNATPVNPALWCR